MNGTFQMARPLRDGTVSQGDQRRYVQRTAHIAPDHLHVARMRRATHISKLLVEALPTAHNTAAARCKHNGRGSQLGQQCATAKPKPTEPTSDQVDAPQPHGQTLRRRDGMPTAQPRHMALTTTPRQLQLGNGSTGYRCFRT